MDFTILSSSVFPRCRRENVSDVPPGGEAAVCVVPVARWRGRNWRSYCAVRPPGGRAARRLAGRQRVTSTAAGPAPVCSGQAGEGGPRPAARLPHQAGRRAGAQALCCSGQAALQGADKATPHSRAAFTFFHFDFVQFETKLMFWWLQVTLLPGGGCCCGPAVGGQGSRYTRPDRWGGHTAGCSTGQAGRRGRTGPLKARPGSITFLCLLCTALCTVH